MSIVTRFYNKKIAQTPKFKNGDIVYLNVPKHTSHGVQLQITQNPTWSNSAGKFVYTVVGQPYAAPISVYEDELTSTPIQQGQAWPQFSVVQDNKGKYFQKRNNAKVGDIADLWPLGFSTGQQPPHRVSEGHSDYKLVAKPKYKIGDTLVTGGGLQGIVYDISYDHNRYDFFYLLDHGQPIGEANDWYENNLKLVKQFTGKNISTSLTPMRPLTANTYPKFKIGDRVGILNTARIQVDAGVIRSINGGHGNAPSVHYGILSDRLGYEISELEDFVTQPQNKFNIGDEVVIIGNESSNFPIGKVGKIKKISYVDNRYLVDFSNGFDRWMYPDDLDFAKNKNQINPPSQPVQPQQPQQQAVQPQPVQDKKVPWVDRMQNVLRGLTVSPTDKSLKKQYEDLLIEQQEQEVKDLSKSYARKKK